MIKKTTIPNAEGEWWRLEPAARQGAAATNDGTAEILIFGDIGDDWAEAESTTARTLIDALAELPPSVRRIIVRINSYGGRVSDGLAIYNALRRHHAEVVTSVEGVAVSIASLIAMAGDTIEMAENSLMMIHAPWAMALGNSRDMRAAADTLDTYAESMASSYARASGRERGDVMALLTDGEDHWYTAAQAVEAGFAHEITDSLAVAASARLPDRFAVPAALAGDQSKPFQMEPPTMTGKQSDAPTDPHKNDGGSGGQPQAALDAVAARNQEIRSAFLPFADQEGIRDLEAHCLADPRMSAEQARNKLLDKLGEGVEPVNPPGYSPFATSATVAQGANHHHAEFRNGLTDAILMRYGVPVANPHPAANDLRHMSSIDICRAALSQSGRRPRSDSKMEIAQAAMTTSDLPELLVNVAEKSMLNGFEESEAASHLRWARLGQLDDFKEAMRVARSEIPGLKKVNEGGEYQHGSMLDAGERIRAETYGRIIALTRQAIINDDLSELARIPNAMGQSAARTEADLVYGLLINNPEMRDETPLFHADHNNIASPAAPNVQSLGEARKLMRTQKGLMGEATLNISPRFLIVPAALETAAEQLLAEIQPSKAGDATPEWIRQLEVVVDSRLDLDSENTWYLAAAPNQFDTVEVARLGGQGAQVLSEEGFDRDEMRFKVRLEVGAAVLDWRGLVMNEGTSP